MKFDKYQWSGRMALPLWEDRRPIVAQAIGGENVFRDAAHGAICKSSFCEGVWWCWVVVRRAEDSNAANPDAYKFFEDYEDVHETEQILETYEGDGSKRASLKIAREKAWTLGFRAAREPLKVVWTRDVKLDRAELSQHDRETWARS